MEGEQGMNTIVVKRATLRDVDFVSDLFDQYRTIQNKIEDPASERIRLEDQLIAQDCVIFVAVSHIGGVLHYLGFAELRPSLSNDSLQKEWMLSDLFVLPEARNTEIESELLTAVMKHTRKAETRGMLVARGVQIPALQNYVDSFHYEDEKQSV
jgi:GNAT superfamily N-acetyltransferase